MRSAFGERLASGGPILFDGAMGTQLYQRGVPYERCFDELNLVQPDLVQEVHRAYIAAGAEVIETNTFAANRVRLADFGLEHRVRDINVRGVRVAREAKEVSGEPVFLGGSVSGIGQPLAPVGTITPEEARSVSADLPILAEVSVGDEGTTLSGATPEDVVRLLEPLDITALGVNCGVGPQSALEAIKRMAPLSRWPLVAMPNAGLPWNQGGRQMYASTPAYFAEYAARFTQAGVAIVGGCCGTTPAHIAAMSAVLDRQPARGRAPARAAVSPPAPEEKAAPTPPPSAPSPLAQKMRDGRFVISVEVDPPRGLNPTKMLQGAA